MFDFGFEFDLTLRSNFLNSCPRSNPYKSAGHIFTVKKKTTVERGYCFCNLQAVFGSVSPTCNSARVKLVLLKSNQGFLLNAKIKEPSRKFKNLTLLGYLFYEI